MDRRISLLNKATEEVKDFQQRLQASVGLEEWSDVAVCALLQALSDEVDVAETLMRLVPVDTPLKIISDLLSMWCWRTDDNGAQIVRTAERWITALEDPRRVEVALTLDVYPFVDPNERLARIRRVEQRWPQLGGCCRPIIDFTVSRGA